MKFQTKDEIILTFANMLVYRKVDTNIVNQALKLICENFSFDYGWVYEADQCNCLNLHERYSTNDVKLCESFNVNEISQEHRDYLVKETILYIDKNDDNAPFQSELLKDFSLSSLVILAISDENHHIDGLLVLGSENSDGKISDADLQALKVLLSMLDGYMRTRTYQNKLSFVQKSLGNILDNAGIDIYVNDFYNHDILYVNKSMAAPYGGVSEFLGNKCWAVLFPNQGGPCEFCPQKQIVDENGEPTKVYSWDYQRSFDGSWFRVFSAAFRWMDGRLAHVVSSANITDNKQKEELIQYMANYDPLTNLPNRRMFLSECEHRIDNAVEGENGYILFFDIDGFKAINDNLGHDAGDEFLVKLGEFFSSIPMLKNSIYRNGGDEFVAIIGGTAISKGNIKTLAGFIHERFKKPWQLKNGEVFCNVSLGVACYPQDGKNAEELIYKADQAMYMVKKAGGGNVIFACDGL